MSIKNLLRISEELPGPITRKLIEKDREFISPSYTRTHPFVVEKAKGAYVEDVDGNVFLDFTAGLATCSTGHCHPDVVRAIVEQAKKLIHMSGTDFYYAVQSSLAEKLSEISPGNEKRKVFFGNSGAEAIEAAIKLSRYYTGRHKIIAFFNSFHGRTMGALSLTASKVVQRKRFSPLIPGIVHASYAYCYRCTYNLSQDNCDTFCVKWIEDTLFKKVLAPEEVAAIFVEPIQGEGGYIVPPPTFHQRLFQLCKKYQILYVADEVQSGMGRTGKMFASEHFNVDPDIMAVAKGIASGMPLGVCVSRAEIMEWEPGSHASTFGGNPISCQAALTTIDLLEKGLIKNALVMGEYLLERLKELQKKHYLMGEVRGKGLMIGIELVKDRETKEIAVEERKELIYRCFQKGLIILGCGESSIRLSPPLIITRKDAELALSIIDESLKEIKS